MNKKIILKSDTFKYPTKEERIEIGKVINQIPRFNIKYKPSIIRIMKDNRVDDAIRMEDIYWWNNCLENRLGKVEQTYVFVNTHYNRHLQSIFDNLEDNHTDKLLLDYFIEIFYYYFFSSRDILAQLLNLFYNLKIAENKIFLNEKFVEKMSSIKTKEALYDFLKETKDSYNIRNTFNHRFTPTQMDSRAKQNIVKEDNKLGFHSPKEVKTEMFIEDIKGLINHLGKLMSKLNNEIK